VQDHDGGADPATPHRSREHEVVFPKPLYSRQQVNKAGEEIEAVLVAADPIEALKKAYPNYFLDTREFIVQIQRVIQQAKATQRGKKADIIARTKAERRCD
jgi:hypothetical protein